MYQLVTEKLKTSYVSDFMLGGIRPTRFSLSAAGCKILRVFLVFFRFSYNKLNKTARVTLHNLKFGSLPVVPGTPLLQQLSYQTSSS